jgi:simple sugar transport system ATP-binding protein
MQATARERIRQFDIRPAEPEVQARRLSGGNLQKLVAARELSTRPSLVVASYPTMGLDIQAAANVYEHLFELARQGSAVLWISEDLDDLLRFAHRIAVLVAGRLQTIVDASHTTVFDIGRAMTSAPATASWPTASNPSAGVVPAARLASPRGGLR